MQIRTLGYDKQCGIKGQIVNVPLDVDSTAKILPRNLDDTHTIQLKLKRRLSYDRAYLCETIRPKKVLDALRYLLDQPLYQSEGITVSTDWEKTTARNNRSQNVDISVVPESQTTGANAGDDVAEITTMISDASAVNHNVTDVNGDGNEESEPRMGMDRRSTQVSDRSVISLYSYLEVVINSGVSVANVPAEDAHASDDNIDLEDLFTDSLREVLQHFIEEEEDVFEREDRNEYLNPGGDETLLDNNPTENIAIAPGENKIPLHLMLDKYAEELSFPTIFCGQQKEFSVEFSYSDIARIQASHRDRRFARTDFVLYMFKKLQLMYVVDAVNVYLRQKIDKEPGTVRVGQVLQHEFLDQLIDRDFGFRFLKKITSSPAHWECEKRKLIDMIRQFNAPTIFITISAAETAWPELLVILSKVVDGRTVSEEEAAHLPFSEKTR